MFLIGEGIAIVTDRTTGQSRGFAFIGIAKDTKVARAVLVVS